MQVGWDDKIWTIVGVIIVTAIVAVGIVATTENREFQGYYLRQGAIYASFDWAVDTKAFDYTPEQWQQILDHNLHLEKVKE